ncbi:hypothetical protein ACI2OX_18140 [Bacillus sp. N9]
MNKDNFGGWVTEQQLTWLQKVIETSGEKPMLIFAHHPVYNTTKKSDESMFHIHSEANIWEVLKEKKEKGYTLTVIIIVIPSSKMRTGILSNYVLY